MNKEAASNTASLLFQSNWSGRAEIGLTGDDSLHFKISADGSNWTEALIVDSSANTMTAAVPVTIEVDDGCALSIDLEEGSSVFQATRYSESSNAPVFMGRKARGSRGTPAAAPVALSRTSAVLKVVPSGEVLNDKLSSARRPRMARVE
jgi:hypothetical protein